MDIEKLFTGIAVIIDDEVGDKDKDSSIKQILKQIDDKNIPYLTYTELPKSEIIEHLKNVSFILLDWRLHKIDELGVNVPEKLGDSDDEDNINFLKKLKEVCFCPVFIFSNEDVESIKDKLESNGLYSKNKCGMFLVRSKSNFIGDGKSLFSELEKWLKENAPIYLLKEWESSYTDAKTKLFIDFQDRSSEWPKYLWQTYKNDKTKPSVEFAEFISRSLESQMQPLNLDDTIFENQSDGKNIDELKACLERQCFIDNKYLDASPNTGDVFKIKNEGTVKYYVNIRPECDMILHNSSKINQLELYLIKGNELKDDEIDKDFFLEYGHFDDNETNFTIFPICNSKCLRIKFKSLKIMKWSELKNNRIGRILPPYITKLQMKYASYLQRQGLPRLPDILFKKE